MDFGGEIDTDKKTGKHKNHDVSHVSEKKLKKFSHKDFRKQLKSNEKFKALKEFLQNIKEHGPEDVALEYLQHGGSIHELLQCLKEDDSLPPVLVIEISNFLLLKIIKCKMECEDVAFQSCRYFLQNFSFIVDKMLGLTSSAQERIVILKFLTSMATNSSHLSKDILTHINFNLTRIEFLSISRVENKAVRKHFVYFLTAILIDIDYPVLSLLLSKKNLLTSIINGLLYDDADTVCFILTAMKHNILENPSVSKTVKMKTFNTIVVKNIVNLYNWKGPSNLKPSKGNTQIMEVDEVQKAKVSQCVHEFLMILCTSHRYGVIFRDPLVGLGKKTQNSLIYTIVESMDSPWEHSYASELIIKICYACPDITKYIWNNIKSVLEPRLSSKWLRVVDFVKRLLDELKPSCLGSYITKLSPLQISQIITNLAAPISVLKVIFPENCTYDLQSVKFHTFSLVSSMLNSIDEFISDCTNQLNAEQYSKLKMHLGNYIEKNFPMGDVFLQNWNVESKIEDKSFNILKYLSTIFDIFRRYIKLCPDLMGSLCFSHDELKIFLETVIFLGGDDVEKEKKQLEINIIDVFLTNNSSLFSLDSDSFNFFLCLLFKTCYENVGDNNLDCFSILRKLLRSTEIFDYGSDREVDIWISGIFSLKSYKDTVPQFITASIKLASRKLVEYLKETSQIQESFKADNYSPNGLSPMIFAVLETLDTFKSEKVILSYINFVVPTLIFIQDDCRIISEIIRRSQSLKSPLLEYVNSILFEEIVSFEIPRILRIFNKDDVFNSFNLSLANDSLECYLNEHEKELYPNLNLDLMQMGIFYFSKLLKSENSQKLTYSKNLKLYMHYLLDKSSFDPDIICNNFLFIHNFSILDIDNGEFNCCTNFIMDFLDCYIKKFDLTHKHMRCFNNKLLRMVFKVLKNPKKYSNDGVLRVMDHFTMNYEAYLNILLKISNSINESFEKCKFRVFYSILVHSLEKYCQSNPEKGLSEDILKNLLAFYTSLNQGGDFKTVELSKQFESYFTKFPEYIESIESNVVNSVLTLKEYHKAHTDFIVFIFKKRHDLFTCINEKLEDLIFVKGLFYPVLQLLSEVYTMVEGENKRRIHKLFHRIHSNFEDVLHKTLRKPQKASQHIDENYKGVCLLIDLNFQKEKYQEYVSKILKFEVTKIFHVHLLNTIFRKFIVIGLDTYTANNTILTFVHSLLNVLKRMPKKEDNVAEILDTVSDSFLLYLDELIIHQNKYDFKITQNNESFKTLLKLVLKYGVSENEKLLQLLKSFISLIGKNFDEHQIELVMDMLISHSEFIDVLLSENHKCKKGILSLMAVICESWPQVMTRSHIPKLLAAYRATVAETDRMIFKLIKMYESVRDDVSFQDFRPYLWGNAGAIHYSVRIDIGDAILKQPKIKDVLNLLQENMVLSTIKYYHLYKNGINLDDIDANTIYDLEFLLPLFIHLLSPENVVQTYHFARSGALSLSLLGLSCTEENMRAATCDVMSRFYFHLEGKQGGKENILYMKLITGICMWMSDSRNAMNNFATIFLARTALILSKSSYSHVMFHQLSQYIVVKEILDLSTIPELYTFLHSSDVNYLDYRQFIFEILTDGLIVENDYKIFSRSMALKLLTELYSASTCDESTKLSILDILIAVCRLGLGVKLICTHSSLLSFLIIDLEENLTSKDLNHLIIVKMKEIITRIYPFLDDLKETEQKIIKMISEKIEKSC